MTIHRLIAAGLAGAILGTPLILTPATAEEPVPIAVTIKDHRFSPAEIHVPMGKPAILRVTNEDQTAEEFDSAALQVEKVIPGGQYGIVRLRPLAPGRYPFIGEFHEATARGAVISDPPRQ